jgi:hypothetical protein
VGSKGQIEGVKGMGSFLSLVLDGCECEFCF